MEELGSRESGVRSRESGVLESGVRIRSQRSEGGVNPNGVAPHSPGLLYAATLGDGACDLRDDAGINPEGVAA